MGLADTPLGFHYLLKDKRLAVIACQDAGAAFQPVLEELRRRRDPATVIAIDWRRAALVRGGIERIVESLARAALNLWPRWYGLHDRPNPTHGGDAGTRLEEIAPGVEGVSTHWLQSAAKLAARAVLPIVPGLEPFAQVDQLSRTLASTEVVLVLACDSADPGDSHSLVDAVRWAASHGRLRVLVLVPSAVATAPELVPIASHVFHLERPKTDEGADTLLLGIWTVDADGRSCSLGEIELRHRISHDHELRPLFSFDERVETRMGSVYQADAVWREGRICVEIDGHRWHSRRPQFNRDRQRDFEMMMSGYLVLRLPHDEVVDDPERALEKVRSLVRFRCQEGRS